ncbi:hypothetical protein U9M48_018380, partial [Paspalum notatum var. saurae]
TWETEHNPSCGYGKPTDKQTAGGRGEIIKRPGSRLFLSNSQRKGCALGSPLPRRLLPFAVPRRRLPLPLSRFGGSSFLLVPFGCCPRQRRSFASFVFVWGVVRPRLLRLFFRVPNPRLPPPLLGPGVCGRRSPSAPLSLGRRRAIQRACNNLNSALVSRFKKQSRGGGKEPDPVFVPGKEVSDR